MGKGKLAGRHMEEGGERGLTMRKGAEGWLLREGKGRNAKYYATEKGKEELKKFDMVFEKV